MSWQGKEDRECPSLRQLQHRAKEEIIRAIETAAGKSFEKIKTGRGIYRQIAVDVLYRRGGLTNRQIGEIFGLDYSTVSVTRKRLQERMMKNKQAEKIVTDIEQELTRIKN